MGASATSVVQVEAQQAWMAARSDRYGGDWRSLVRAAIRTEVLAELRDLATGPAWVCMAVASNIHCPPDLLDQLGVHESALPRGRVAVHTSTRRPTLRCLAHDPEEYVARCAQTTLRELYHDDSSEEGR